MQNYIKKLIIRRKQNKMAALLSVHLMVKFVLLKKIKMEKIANIS